MAAKQQFYPLLFKPVYKDYVWGGARISSRYGRVVPGERAAESWEISDRPEGMSVVINGSLAGKTLHELVNDHVSELLGAGLKFSAFPLLLKIIDARERLSVQVHPDDDSAMRAGGEAKTEMWIVLDAEPDAMVYAGFKAASSEAEFRAALAEDGVDRLLQALPVKRGDAIYIPGGRIHAIGAGCLLLEVQQNSNTTYRVYDWGRVGNDGKPRELHIEQAISVIRWDDIANPKVAGEGEDPARLVPGQTDIGEIWSCPYFRVERARFSGKIACAMDGRSFHVLFVERGRVSIECEAGSVDAGPGTSILVPSAAGDCRVRGVDAELLRISLP